MRKRISVTATLKFRWNQGNEKRRLLFGRYYIIQRGITGEFNFFYLRVRECQEMQSGEEYAKSSIEMADGQAGCIDTKEYYDDRKDFWLRLYLDKTKKNYVEFFSDQHGFETDYMMDHNGFRADFLDNGEQAYCYDWRGTREGWPDGSGDKEFRQYQYGFELQEAGAHIQVEKEETDLFALAQKIVKSVVFP